MPDSLLKEMLSLNDLWSYLMLLPAIAVGIWIAKHFKKSKDGIRNDIFSIEISDHDAYTQVYQLQNKSFIHLDIHSTAHYEFVPGMQRSLIVRGNAFVRSMELDETPLCIRVDQFTMTAYGDAQLNILTIRPGVIEVHVFSGLLKLRYADNVQELPFNTSFVWYGEGLEIRPYADAQTMMWRAGIIQQAFYSPAEVIAQISRVYGQTIIANNIAIVADAPFMFEFSIFEPIGMVLKRLREWGILKAFSSDLANQFYVIYPDTTETDPVL